MGFDHFLRDESVMGDQCNNWRFMFDLGIELGLIRNVEVFLVLCGTQFDRELVLYY